MTGPSSCQWAPHATLRPGMESRPQLTMPANLAPLAPARLLRLLESKMTIKYPQNVSLLIVTVRTGTQWHDFRGGWAEGPWREAPQGKTPGLLEGVLCLGRKRFPSETKASDGCSLRVLPSPKLSDSVKTLSRRGRGPLQGHSRPPPPQSQQ